MTYYEEYDKNRNTRRLWKLKVKIKSLTAEAIIIRKEEAKAKWGFIRYSLACHRSYPVGWEARHTLLAYGFLRGREYLRLEKPHKDNPPDWKKVKAMVEKYCAPAEKQTIGDQFDAWMEAGVAYFNAEVCV